MFRSPLTSVRVHPDDYRLLKVVRKYRNPEQSLVVSFLRSWRFCSLYPDPQYFLPLFVPNALTSVSNQYSDSKHCPESRVRLLHPVPFSFDLCSCASRRRSAVESEYSVALLHDSLGVALDDERIKAAYQIGSIPLDWALGAFNMQSTADSDVQNHNLLWVKLSGTDLLPGDVVSIGCSSGQNGEEKSVPADMLISPGSSIVNDAILTGEPTPQ
ncbi:hypothetical protein K1719_004628 [Acacia pycnantha]|nr:hypothetical protein K1719_004628 [Acacia pycnantha]